MTLRIIKNKQKWHIFIIREHLGRILPVRTPMQMYSCSRLEVKELRIRPAEDRRPPRMMATLQEIQFPRKPPRGAANSLCRPFRKITD